MDLPVKAQAKQSSEYATENHPWAQVVTQGQSLSKYPTVKNISKPAVIPQAKHTNQESKKTNIIPKEHADSICNKEAVVQDSKQVLVIVLVWI